MCHFNNIINKCLNYLYIYIYIFILLVTYEFISLTSHNSCNKFEISLVCLKPPFFFSFLKGIFMFIDVSIKIRTWMDTYLAIPDFLGINKVWFIIQVLYLVLLLKKKKVLYLVFIYLFIIIIIIIFYGKSCTLLFIA